MIDDYDLLPTATHRTLYRAERSGLCTSCMRRRLGRATMLLGAGRNRVEDLVEPSAGGVLFVKRGQRQSKPAIRFLSCVTSKGPFWPPPWPR